MLYRESEAPQCHVSQQGADWHNGVDVTSATKPAESTLLPDKGTVASLLSRQTQGILPSFIFLQVLV